MSGPPETDDDPTWLALLDTSARLVRGLLADERDEGPTHHPYHPDATADTNAYHHWLAQRRAAGVEIEGHAGPAHGGPRLAVLLLPSESPPGEALDTLRSVLAQEYGRWTLAVVRPPDGIDEDMEALVAVDDRVQVVQESAWTEGAGDWVVFLRAGDTFDPAALGAVASAVSARPDAVLCYSDEDAISEEGQRFWPRFKPDWSPELLLATPYVGDLTAVRRDVFAAVGGLHVELGDAAAYDLVLRAGERGAVLHLPHVLYHRRLSPQTVAVSAGLPTPADAERQHAVLHALERRGEAASLEPGPLPATSRVRRRLDRAPFVSVIVPFRDEASLLRTCIDTVTADPGWDRYELVLVDNDSSEPETLSLLDRLADDERVRLHRVPGPFNWSAINNAAVPWCRGEVLLFLNNDIEARVGGWMLRMLEHVQRPEVGAVGARLLYPDRTVQHAGVVYGLGGLAAHVLSRLPADAPGYLGSAVLTRDVSVVTAACMMCRREVFDAVGRFDEQLAVAFNDVDFCMRLTAAGYHVIYEAGAELVHHESFTRGFTGFHQDQLTFLRRWSDRIRAEDPFFSPNLSRLDLRCVVRPVGEDQRWEFVHWTLKHSSSD